MTEDPAPSRRDGLIALAVAGLVLGTVVVGARAPAPVHEPAAPRHAALPEDDPACSEWGDGCHVCRRLPEGDACSLPGIACTPGRPRCLRRSDDP